MEHRDALVQLVLENQVVVVVGETGSGKSTQIPQYMWEAFKAAHPQKLIGVTQPRRVAAISLAQRIGLEVASRHSHLPDQAHESVCSDVVGYSVRFDDKTGPSTRIKFMTDGVLLREFLSDDMLDSYSCIIIDEAHERSLFTDVLMALLRKVAARRSDLKVVVMSATLDASKFAEYFGNCPVYSISGRTFPVEIHHSATVVHDYVEAAVQRVLKIHLGGQPGDVLVFMTGQEDILVTCSLIAERWQELVAKDEAGTGSSALCMDELAVVPLFSLLSGDLQSDALFAPVPGKRKIIIATNIAETSVTVPTVRFVVDCGFSKMKVFNAGLGLDMLQVYPISQAAAQQRAGRAGRTAPGVCYRLYTE
jgi:pre-mRNA-splicing factor ATP-dependent RNA helicase DHX38/PRP16